MLWSYSDFIRCTQSKRFFMWQLETQLLASRYIYLSNIFEANYSTLVMRVGKKSSADQSELEKVVSDCKKNCMVIILSILTLLMITSKKWSFPLRIFPHFLKKCLMENFFFCVADVIKKVTTLIQIFIYFTNVLKLALREKCPNRELFLVLIFLYSVQILENKEQK